jgi:hypothetical protein
MENRLSAARLVLGADTAFQSRDQVLSQEEVPAFLRELRSRAGALGAKVANLEHSPILVPPGHLAPVLVRGKLVAEGKFAALYALLHYLENRRVFVAVDRAEIRPAATTDGRRNAVFHFEFLVVPAPAGDAEGQR